MWFNPLLAGVLRSPLHSLLSRNTMLITVRGRKTGRPVKTPVNYLRFDGELLMVSLRSRIWWRNLRGGAPVELLLAGARRKATATVFEAEVDVRRGLADMVSQSPALARLLGIGLDDTGSPRAPDLARAAQSRVIIRAQLISGQA